MGILGISKHKVPSPDQIFISEGGGEGGGEIFPKNRVFLAK